MKIWDLRRDLGDGRTAWGPLFYIIIVLLIIGGFIYLNFRNYAPERPRVNTPGSADVSNVTNAARSFREVQTPNNTEGGNSRLAIGSGANGETPADQGLLDTIALVDSMATQTQQGRPRNVNESVNPSSRQENPEVVPVAAGAPTPRPRNVQSLVVYEAPTPAPTPVPTAPQPTPQPTGFETNRFIPRGEYIPVYFLSKVETLALEDIVTLAVAENVVFNHKVQIPFGTRILATASGSAEGRRIAINADTLIFPDGQELPISGIGKGLDRGPGVPGYYIPQPLWVRLLPYVNSFTAAYLDSLQNTIPSTVSTIGPDGTTIAQELQVTDTSDPGSVALASASQALREQMTQTQAELTEAYPSYVTIPPGTAAWIQLRSALDLTQRRVNGAANSQTTILPGFEQNPITPSGRVAREAFPTPTPIPSSQQGLTTLEGSTTGTTVPRIPRPSTTGAIPNIAEPVLRQEISEANQSGATQPIRNTFGLD